MGLPGEGKRVKVTRTPDSEPIQIPEREPEQAPAETPEREPVKVGE